MIMDNEIPERIKKRIFTIENEFNSFIKSVYEVTKGTKLSLSLTFSHSAGGDILTNSERYQQVCFLTRYDCLPEFDEVQIIKIDDKYFFANLNYMRHLLNEYRLLIFNKSDPIYYRKLHNFCYTKLKNDNPKIGLSISAYDENNELKTNELINLLNAHTKAIGLILDNCDLDYLYNGVLQHADSKHTDRYWTDYYSGELNYIFLRNTLLVNELKRLMKIYCNIMCLTYPRLGGL